MPELRELRQFREEHPEAEAGESLICNLDWHILSEAGQKKVVRRALRRDAVRWKRGRTIFQSAGHVESFRSKPARYLLPREGWPVNEAGLPALPRRGAGAAPEETEAAPECGDPSCSRSPTITGSGSGGHFMTTPLDALNRSLGDRVTQLAQEFANAYWKQNPR